MSEPQDTVVRPLPQPKRAFTATEFMARGGTSPEWLLDHVLPVNGTVVFAANPYTGKTRTMVGLAAAATAKSGSFAGLKLGDTGRPALLFALEHDEDSCGASSMMLRAEQSGLRQ